jgi:hypothetical protein
VINAMNHSGLFPTVILAGVLLVLGGTACSQSIVESVGHNSCSADTLPNQFRQKLSTDFGAWKIHELGDLSAFAKARWDSAKYAGCPGFAIGEFRENNRQSYAVIIVPREKPDSAYRLMIYTPSGPQFKEEFQIVDKGDVAGASNFFLHTARSEKLFDAPSRRKFHIGNNDSLLFFDCGEKEYEVEAYYFSNGKYHSSFVDM